MTPETQSLIVSGIKKWMETNIDKVSFSGDLTIDHFVGGRPTELLLYLRKMERLEWSSTPSTLTIARIYSIDSETDDRVRHYGYFDTVVEALKGYCYDNIRVENLTIRKLRDRLLSEGWATVATSMDFHISDDKLTDMGYPHQCYPVSLILKHS